MSEANRSLLVELESLKEKLLLAEINQSDSELVCKSLADKFNNQATSYESLKKNYDALIFEMTQVKEITKDWEQKIKDYEIKLIAEKESHQKALQEKDGLLEELNNRNMSSSQSDTSNELELLTVRYSSLTSKYNKLQNTSKVCIYEIIFYKL